jgi:6-phospho-beta-glucosidase
MKTVVLGGGSFSTPALFSALAASGISLANNEFVLVGRTVEHLTANERAVALVSGFKHPAVTVRCCEPETAGPALLGADVVLVQIRAGGFEGRIFDESFPLQFGICGDEGLGPGGLSAALRAWPVVKPWLAAVERNAPQALVVMVSSPVGILVRASRTCFPGLRCYGICEVPYVCLREVCCAIGQEWTTAEYSYLGINHLGWLYDFRAQGRDLVAEWASLSMRTGFPDHSLIETYGGIPTKYFRLHFEREQVLREQRTLPVSRGAELCCLRAAAYQTYCNGDVHAVGRLLGRRQTPWYSDAIAPLLLGLLSGDAGVPLFFSAPNAGYTDQIGDDDILEMPYRLANKELIRGRLSSDPPELIKRLVYDYCCYERLATAALLNGNEADLATALAEHPWVEDAQTAESLARMIVAQRDAFTMMKLMGVDAMFQSKNA